VASASLTESILNPIPVVSSAQATETVVGGTSYSLDVMGTGFISTSQLQVGWGDGALDAGVFDGTAQHWHDHGGGWGDDGGRGGDESRSGDDDGKCYGSGSEPEGCPAGGARLLDQATFGPTLSDISHVQAVGLNAYLTEQFAVPTTLLPDIAATPPTVCVNTLLPCEQSEWWQTMLTAAGPAAATGGVCAERDVCGVDELCECAVSDDVPEHAGEGRVRNFYTILQDVTLSPAMGAYLNMLNSAKPATGQIANENYARELMQLFATGLFLLNQDGTLQLDANGNAMPVYSEAQVQAFCASVHGVDVCQCFGYWRAGEVPKHGELHDADGGARNPARYDGEGIADNDATGRASQRLRT